ncbi:MAG TPA: response regulator transcription factor [Cyclobacteriaceae bacterium]|nr:response regulator transcription factor [Cyclobacteriaceae bacterium]HRJ81790.1 response regulator transcription factor [Cyclobacteriaceae bacterium]
MKVLLIEDEAMLAQDILKHLQTQHYTCEWVTRISEAEEKINLYKYDCILLDLALPDGNGLSLLQNLNQHHNTEGVIVISAKHTLEDKIKGLNLGADDYMVKPFHLAELSARISAVIRRKQAENANVIVLHDLKIDLPSRSVYCKAGKIDLTRKEFDLLIFLYFNKNRVVSKNAIAEHISGDHAESFTNLDYIYSHIKNLKKKLTERGCDDYIKTIYGIGYRMEV